jgi:hypothetical protein
MQDQKEILKQVESALVKLRKGDLSSFSDFKKILDLNDGEDILQIALRATPPKKDDLDILQACLMAFDGVTPEGLPINGSTWFFLANMKASFPSDLEAKHLEKLISAFGSVLRPDQTLSLTEPDLEVVKNFYYSHIIQARFNSKIQFEDWKNLINQMLRLRRFLMLGDEWLSRSKQQIAKIDACLHSMGMLEYEVIRLPDTCPKQIEELEQESANLNSLLTQKASNINNSIGALEAEISNIVTEVQKLSLSSSSATEVISLQKTLKNAQAKLQTDLRNLYRKTTESTDASNKVRGLLLIENQLSDLQNQLEKCDTTQKESFTKRINDKTKEQEDYISFARISIPNFDTFIIKARKFNLLLSLLENAQSKIDLFRRKNDPNFYAMLDYKNYVAQNFAVIYVNDKLYKVTATNFHEETQYIVEEIAEQESKKHAFERLKSSLAPMTPGSIKFANAEETFDLTDVIPSTSEVLRTKNIINIIVDFVYEFKIFLLNTFYPDLSFNFLETQCDTMLSNRKYADNLDCAENPLKSNNDDNPDTSTTFDM